MEWYEYMGVSLGVCVILGGVVGALICRHYEKKTWNNGVCAETGNPWISFDTDSQGGRGYKSEYDSGEPDTIYIWISYNVDKIDERRVG